MPLGVLFLWDESCGDVGGVPSSPLALFSLLEAPTSQATGSCSQAPRCDAGWRQGSRGCDAGWRQGLSAAAVLEMSPGGLCCPPGVLWCEGQAAVKEEGTPSMAWLAGMESHPGLRLRAWPGALEGCLTGLSSTQVPRLPVEGATWSAYSWWNFALIQTRSLCLWGSNT